MKRLTKRIVLLVLGLIIMASGTSAMIRAGLGTSPPSSTAYVLSLCFPRFTVGVWLFFWGILLLVIQMLIKRREFKARDFLQIPVAIVYGSFVDFWNPLVNRFPVDVYAKQMVLLILACVLIAVGVVMTALSDLSMNSSDSTARAISDTAGKEFGTMKIAVDVCHVLLAVLLSLGLLGRLEGVREGTLIAAVLPGFIIRLWMPLVRGKCDKWLSR